MLLARIIALHLTAKLHTHSKERGNQFRLFNQIYRHFLDAFVVFFRLGILCVKV